MILTPSAQLCIGDVVQFEGGWQVHTGPVAALFSDGALVVADPADGSHTWTVDRSLVSPSTPSYPPCQRPNCVLAYLHESEHVLVVRRDGKE